MTSVQPGRQGAIHQRRPFFARLNAWRKRSLLSPYWLDWRHLRRSVQELSRHSSGLMLDIGVAERPYAQLFEDRIERYVGLEYPPAILDKQPEMWRILSRVSHSVDVFGDGNHLPFGDGTLDTVLATELLEHLPRPHTCVREMARVLKPGGRVLVTVPFLHLLHELPSDYYRFTPSSLREMAEDGGLEVESITPRGNLATAVGVLAVQYLLRTLGAREVQSDGSVLPSPWRNLLLAPFYALIQAVALGLSRLSDNTAITLGYSLVARKPAP